jgi:thioredoxin-like negative regulator of GroEL
LLLERHEPLVARSARLNLLRARACLALGRREQARAAARRACDLDAESTDARLMLAYATLETGDAQSAATLASQLLAADPADEVAKAIIDHAAGPNPQGPVHIPLPGR